MSDSPGTLAGGWPDVRVAYDAVAADYAGAFADELEGKAFDRMVLDDLATRVGPGALVADLGCGPAGQVGAYLQRRGLRVVGVDLSPRCAALSPLPTAAGDLARPPLRVGSLDAVVCFYALIHLPRAAVAQALSALRALLRPEGRLLVAVHAGTGDRVRRGWYGRDVEVRWTLFGREELARLLTDAGFDDVRVARRQPYDGELPTQRLYATASAPAAQPGAAPVRGSAGTGPARSG